jgi:hypothetical protein
MVVMQMFGVKKLIIKILYVMKSPKGYFIELSILPRRGIVFIENSYAPGITAPQEPREIYH